MTKRIEVGMRRRFRDLLGLVRPRRLDFGVDLLMGRVREGMAREGVTEVRAFLSLYLFTRQRVAKRLVVTGACTLAEAPWSRFTNGVPAFLCDRSLAGLGRWLRAAGYEAHDAAVEKGDALLQEAARHGRRAGHERRGPPRAAGGAGGGRGRAMGADGAQPDGAARPSCSPIWASACASRAAWPAGATLEAVAKEQLGERIPPRTARWKDDYWVCGSCARALLAGHPLGADHPGAGAGGGVKGKAFAQNAALALATTVLFAGSLELGARLLEKPTPAAAPVADYIWDWREKMEGDFYVIRSEAVGWPPWEEINADGLRDRTHPTEKPPGTHRLVALGDSVTLGAGIKPEEAFPQVLERRLWRDGRRVEVMNVGLWGWSTRQERMAYERIVRRYRPDQVLLAVCLNDIPELQNNLARPPALLAALFKRSALVRRVMNASGREIQNVEQLFTDRDTPRVREAFARFFDEVRALRDEVGKDGATFALAVFPFRFQVAAGGA